MPTVAVDHQDRPAASDVPTLHYAGEYGPTAPVAWVESAWDASSRSRLVALPGVGHVITPTAPCPLAMCAAFLADPTVPLDTACVARDDRTPGFVAATWARLATVFTIP